jgi:hypothetical protein
VTAPNPRRRLADRAFHHRAEGTLRLARGGGCAVGFPEVGGALDANSQHGGSRWAKADLDAREADRIFRLLMGDNVEGRRRFIEDNAVNVKNLDV